MGRRPKPSDQRRLEGKPGHRPLNANEPTAVAGLPRCPSHIKGEARREWNRIGKRLVAERRMAHVFKAAFAAYCVAWGRWVEAERQLEEFGTVIMTNQTVDKEGKPVGGGNLVQSPYLAIANKAQQQMMKAISELGISPTSQAKVSTVKHGATVTRFEAFLGGKFDNK